MRTLLNYNIAQFSSSNAFGFPDVKSYTGQIDCLTWIDFDCSVKAKDSENSGLHFFIDDYKFERIWLRPQKYISLFSRFKYVIMPDFSLYFDFPPALQIYNKYRNHWLSAYYTSHGINIVPNISRSTPNNFDWVFMGYPKNSVVAFSDIGGIRDRLSKSIILANYTEMVKRLQPSEVLYFTRSSKEAPEGATKIVLPFLKGD